MQGFTYDLSRLVIQRLHHETAPLRSKGVPDVALVGAGARTGVGAGTEAEAGTVENATYHEKRRTLVAHGRVPLIFAATSPIFLFPFALVLRGPILRLMTWRNGISPKFLA